MRTLIVYHSEHHGNTEKIARAIAPILDAELLKSAQLASALGSTTASSMRIYTSLSRGFQNRMENGRLSSQPQARRPTAPADTSSLVQY